MLDKETQLKFMMEHYRAWLAFAGLTSLDDLVKCPTHAFRGHTVYEFDVGFRGMLYKMGISKAVVDALISGDPDRVIKEGEAFNNACGEGSLTDGTYTRWGGIELE